jgi:hypothetical protein
MHQNNPSITLRTKNNENPKATTVTLNDFALKHLTPSAEKSLTIE